MQKLSIQIQRYKILQNERFWLMLYVTNNQIENHA